MKNVKDLQLNTPKEQMDSLHKIQTQKQEPQAQRGCFRCGGSHSALVCRHKVSQCHKCLKVGHLARKCRASFQRFQQGPQKDLPIHKEKGKKLEACYLEEAEREEGLVHTMYSIKAHRVAPYTITVDLNNEPVCMEIDTGASVTVINEKTYQQSKVGLKALENVKVKLQTYTGEKIPVVGSVWIPVKYKGQQRDLQAVVIKGDRPNLLGRNWLKELKMDWEEICHLDLKGMPAVKSILSAHSAVFQEGLGTLKGIKARLYMKEGRQPKYFKPRPVPYALRDKIEAEINRLEKEGIISPVQFSEWATPIVPVAKPDKTIRICGDYKVTVNQASKLDNYPIPRIEDLLAVLGGGQHFSKLDMSQAYQQMELEEDFKKFTTINTHKGLYQYNRLPYGISSAPGIFQRAMEHLLKEIPGVVVRIDDILITGKDEKAHLGTLELVLRRLEELGLRLRQNKCFFMKPEVQYLGYKINQGGMQSLADKVAAIDKAPAPQNTTVL